MNNRFRFWAICVLLAVILWPTGRINAQIEEPDGCLTHERYKINYHIQIMDKGVDKGIISNRMVLYLEGYQCSALVYLDSAVVKKGKAKFKSKRSVDKGVYRLVYEKGGTPVRDIFLMVSNPSLTSIASGDGFLKIGNNYCDPEYYALKYAKMSDEILHHPSAITSLDTFRRIIETYSDSPGYYLEQFYLYDNALSAYLSVLQQNPQLIIPQSIYDYVISKLNLSDPLLWDSKFALHPFIAKYLTDNQIFDAEYLMATIESLLTKCEGDNQKHYLAAFLFNAFWATGDPSYDAVLLYLYDNYDFPCWLGDRARLAKRKMDVVRKLAPGAQIPELTAYDINGKQHSTNEIQTKYTILWFWDPDCDHCQEMTPMLHDLYQEKADELDFEVFAVEVNDDYDRWKAFSEKHGLGDWINLSTSMGETSVDYIEYFDIVTTPVILLIDNENNHAIIARQISLEEVEQAMNR